MAMRNGHPPAHPFIYILAGLFLPASGSGDLVASHGQPPRLLLGTPAEVLSRTPPRSLQTSDHYRPSEWIPGHATLACSAPAPCSCCPAVVGGFAGWCVTVRYQTQGSICDETLGMSTVSYYCCCTPNVRPLTGQHVRPALGQDRPVDGSLTPLNVVISMPKRLGPFSTVFASQKTVPIAPIKES